MNIALFGGSGGLGSNLFPLLKKNNEFNEIYSLSSRDLDVTDFEKVNEFFKNHEIDIVINLSGYNYDSFMHKYNLDNINEINKQININIVGTNNILASCLPKMREKKFGRIILASSILSSRPVIGTSIYSASKGYIDTITKVVALENANKNITCNSLQLGYFDAGMTYKIEKTIRKQIIESIPMKRLGKIEELYSIICFLINTEYITGINHKINGGSDF